MAESSVNTGVALASLAFRWHNQAHEVLTPLKLSTTQYLLLSGVQIISETEEHVTQAAVGRLVGADAMLVSKNIRTLEENKFIERRVHPVDSRAWSVKLTKSGAATLKNAAKLLGKIESNTFGKGGSEKLYKPLVQALGWG